MVPSAAWSTTRVAAPSLNVPVYPWADTHAPLTRSVVQNAIARAPAVMRIADPTLRASELARMLARPQRGSRCVRPASPTAPTVVSKRAGNV